MNEELLASYWTHAGNAAPLDGDETSPVSLIQRIEIAGRTGWSGMGLVHAIPARERAGAARIGAAGFPDCLPLDGASTAGCRPRPWRQFEGGVRLMSRKASQATRKFTRTMMKNQGTRQTKKAEPQIWAFSANC
jgi:hypothetical protein